MVQDAQLEPEKAKNGGKKQQSMKGNFEKWGKYKYRLAIR